MVRHRLRSTPSIFLSYSHKDRAFGVRLVDFLRGVLGNNDAVWYDDGLRGGEAWWDEIVKQLHNRNAFIVILSPDAVKSPYVKEEMRIALQRHLEGKMLFLPLLLRKCRPPRTLRTRQVLPFLSLEEYESSLKKVFEALGLSPDIDSSAFLNTDPVKPVNVNLVETDIENTLSGKQNQSQALKIKDVDQTFLIVEDAFKTQNWDYVIAVTGALIKLYPESLPSSIYYMRGRAYLYTETSYDDRYACAEEALECAIDRVEDANLRIELLDAYALCLVEQNKSKELESCIEQALQLSPADPVWRLLQKEMPVADFKEESLDLKSLDTHINKLVREKESEGELHQTTIGMFSDSRKSQLEKHSNRGKYVLRLSGITLLLATPFLISPIAQRLLKR